MKMDIAIKAEDSETVSVQRGKDIFEIKTISTSSRINKISACNADRIKVKGTPKLLE